MKLKGHQLDAINKAIKTGADLNQVARPAVGFHVKRAGLGAVIKLSRDGLPIDPEDWIMQDWQDLHDAIKEVTEKIAARHKPTVEKGTL